MRDTDEWAIETRGMPSLELMERAGEGLARVVAQHGPAGRVAVVCGKGNNGGDGFVAARLLRQAGREVTVLTVFDPKFLQGDAAEMLRKLPGAEARAVRAPTRLARDARDRRRGAGHRASAARRATPVDGVIAAINGAKARVIACDVPSGVDASTGEVEGEAVRAVATATFHRAKPGLWIHPGKGYAGEVARDRHRDPARRAGEAGRRADRLDGAARPAAARRRRRPSSPRATCSSSAARAG